VAMPFCFFFQKITISNLALFRVKSNCVSSRRRSKCGGDGDERDENTVSTRKRRGVDMEFMPNLLMAAIFSLPPNHCCFTIFFLVAMFDFWPILWMASLHCYFSHLFHTMQQ
jgi:hypothetical protein